jgi:aryl-alcohol dehydrogenase-like predicted oxidoreductase
MMSSTLNTTTSSIAIPTIKCNNGVEVPVLGFGTAIKPDGLCTKEDVSEDVKLACSEGFRHIDCAERYGNEESVGAALKELDVSRKELFIVTKCMCPFSITTLRVTRNLPTLTLGLKVGTDPDPKASLQKSLSLVCRLDCLALLR